MDGNVNNADHDQLLGNFGSVTPPTEGRVSSADIGNTIGYDGYVYDPAVDMYCVRFRWHSASLGRWVNRDPGQYFGGLNLFEYCSGSVLAQLGALGLQPYLPDPITIRPERRPPGEDGDVGSHWYVLSPCARPTTYDDLAQFIDWMSANNIYLDCLRISAHGSPGSTNVLIHGQQINLWLLNAIRALRHDPNAYDSNPQLRGAIRNADRSLCELTSRCKNIEMYSCNTGSGRAGEAYNDLMQDLYYDSAPAGHSHVGHGDYLSVPGLRRALRVTKPGWGWMHDRPGYDGELKPNIITSPCN